MAEQKGKQTKYVVLRREEDMAYRPIAEVEAWSKENAITAVADKIEASEEDKFRAVSSSAWGEAVRPKVKVERRTVLEVVAETVPSLDSLKKDDEHVQLSAV